MKSSQHTSVEVSIFTIDFALLVREEKTSHPPLFHYSLRLSLVRICKSRGFKQEGRQLISDKMLCTSKQCHNTAHGHPMQFCEHPRSQMCCSSNCTPNYTPVQGDWWGDQELLCQKTLLSNLSSGTPSPQNLISCAFLFAPFLQARFGLKEHQILKKKRSPLQMLEFRALFWQARSRSALHILDAKPEQGWET